MSQQNTQRWVVCVTASTSEVKTRKQAHFRGFLRVCLFLWNPLFLKHFLIPRIKTQLIFAGQLASPWQQKGKEAHDQSWEDRNMVKRPSPLGLRRDIKRVNSWGSFPDAQLVVSSAGFPFPDVFSKILLNVQNIRLKRISNNHHLINLFFRNLGQLHSASF